MKNIVIAVALLSIVACHKREENRTGTTALPVEVAKPVVKDITLTREYPGHLEADATIPIVGRVNGTIVKRNFTEGGRVKKGDLLFVIEPTLYENAVTQAQASLQTEAIMSSLRLPSNLTFRKDSTRSLPQSMR